jgi:hypothetical protein
MAMIASLLLVVGFGKERELMRERERKRDISTASAAAISKTDH